MICNDWLVKTLQWPGSSGPGMRSRAQRDICRVHLQLWQGAQAKKPAQDVERWQLRHSGPGNPQAETSLHSLIWYWWWVRSSASNLDSVLKSRDTTLLTKVHLLKAMVFPEVKYGCESWTINKAERQRIDAFELWCWRRPLRVPWTVKRSNQSILKEISPDSHWKDLCWSWSSNILATWCEEPAHLKRPQCGERLKAGGEGGDRG